MAEENIAKLTAPDIKIAGLEVWVKGRQFPQCTDYWDGNWLQAIACCSTDAQVETQAEVRGAFLHLTELKEWLLALNAFDTSSDVSSQTEASLVCMEPELSVSIKPDGFQCVDLRVEMTPDLSAPAYSFDFKCERNELSLLAKQCEKILTEYPIKGLVVDN